MLNNYFCGPNANIGPNGSCTPIGPTRPPKGWRPPPPGSRPNPPAFIENPVTGFKQPYSAMQIAANAIGLGNQDKLVAYSYFDWAELPPGDPNAKNMFKVFATHVKTAKRVDKNYDPIVPVNAILRQMGATPLMQLAIPANKLRPKQMQALLSGMGCGACTAMTNMHGLGADATPQGAGAASQIKAISDSIFGTAANAMKTYFEFKTMQKAMKNGMPVNQAAQETYQETFFTGRNIGIIGGIAIAGIVLYMIMKRKR